MHTWEREYDFALGLAREVIEPLRLAFSQPHQITAKPGAGIATETDRRTEAWVRERVAAQWPDHIVLGEEQGLASASGGPGAEAETERPCWIVDPIDGTTNFAAGTPLFAFSLGLVQDRRLRVGVCVDPLREEIFSAAEGRGAFLNGNLIRCTRKDLTSESCLAMPSNGSGRLARVLERVVERAKLRNTGSTVLNACYVAAGRFESCFASQSYLWDIAAASLVVLEAGGRVSDPEGRELFPLPESPARLRERQFQFVCSAAHLHDRVLSEFIGA